MSLVGASGLSREASTGIAFAEATHAAMQRLGRIPPKPAAVFITSHHHDRAFEGLNHIRTRTGVEHVTGCTGWGVLTDEGEVEGAPAVSVLLIAGDDLSITSVHNEGGDESAGYALGGSMEDAGAVVMLPGPSTFDPAEFFKGFQDRAGGRAIVGGLAAAGASVPRLGLFHGLETHEAGVSALALTGGFTMEAIATHSAEPFGPVRLITESEGSRLLRLEGSTPLEVLQDALGSQPESRRAMIARSLLGGYAPVVRKPDLERGDFILRNLTDLDQEAGSVGIAAPIAPGMKFAFHYRDSGIAEVDLRDRMEQVKARLGDRLPAFGLYFNCMGRGQNLYGRANVDVELIRKHLGEFPLAGFFGNGEIAPLEGVNVLHNYTGVLALFLDA